MLEEARRDPEAFEKKARARPCLRRRLLHRMSPLTGWGAPRGADSGARPAELRGDVPRASKCADALRPAEALRQRGVLT